MNPFKRFAICFLFASIYFTANAQQTSLTKQSFSILNLSYPGLEKVQANVNAGKYNEAAAALLNYFRQKYKNRQPDFSNAEVAVDLKQPLNKDTKAMADSALLHRFKPHKGYGYFNYGSDINWQYWPVKDNEVRWQLHRVKWWQALALSYHSTGDEKYAREWMLQFTDWVKKNPLGFSADNDRFAWRPLEVSDRVQSLVPTFTIFIKSPSFTPAFLMEFLNSYYQQADYLPANYAAEGNHRLFEAQRVLFAGASFPELKNAEAWRKSGIAVLNTEIEKQVYPDGMQFELSPVYHAASIDIFLKAYKAAQTAGVEKEFPASYLQTIEKMVMAFINITFPDYNQPMFGDSWIADKKFRLKQFRLWYDVFPRNEVIRYFAADGKKGSEPDWLSKGLTTAGFYSFRNGWDSSATVMVLKASPPGEFHAQPDNGTLELWVNGRNFTPDAGCYVYGGDAEIMKLRNWYRQTRVHSTLTLNDSNMLITRATLKKWETGNKLDLLTYSNPSYAGLEHQRSVLFIDKKYFLIIDRATGNDTGKLGIHFQLKEDSNPVFNKTEKKVYTTYSNGNNLLIQSLNQDNTILEEEEGKVSYEYRKEFSRPAFAFEKIKQDAQTQSFISILYPFEGSNAPQITLRENAGNDYNAGKINLTLKIDNKVKKIVVNLN